MSNAMYVGAGGAKSGNGTTSVPLAARPNSDTLRSSIRWKGPALMVGPEMPWSCMQEIAPVEPITHSPNEPGATSSTWPKLAAGEFTPQQLTLPEDASLAQIP